MCKFLDDIIKFLKFVQRICVSMEDKQPYKSYLVARYLRALASKNGRPLNMTQVQKLLYIAYGAIWAKYNFAFIDEKPKAWPFGPVFPNTRKSKYVDYGRSENVEDPEFSEIRKDVEINKILEEVANKYSSYSAGTLSGWSHSPGGPWDRIVRESGEKWNTPIPDDYIRDYFSKINI